MQKEYEYWRCLWSKVINMWIVGNHQDKLFKLKFLADSLALQAHNAWFSLQDTHIRWKSAGKTGSQFVRITFLDQK